MDNINGIEVKNLSFHYSNSDKMIFNNVNMKVSAGEFVSLLGPSGCGKSTLLRILSGLEVPSSGEIYLGDKIIEGADLSKGVVFQDYGLFPWMTAGENIILALKQKFPELSKKELKNKAEEAILSVGLNRNVFNQLPKELSGGMKQRCGIARAFAIDPPVLLMDEPFGALDAITRAKLQDLVIELWQQGNPKKTVFFVTHDVDEALLLSEKIYVLGQSGNDIIYQTKVTDKQRLKRGERENEENTRLRSDLIHYINMDVSEKLNINKGGK